jgi:hypothetical protein
MISTKKVPNSKSGCHISTKKRQCNDQKKKDKGTNNGRQNTRQKKKVWTTWTPLLKGWIQLLRKGKKFLLHPLREWRLMLYFTIFSMLNIVYCVSTSRIYEEAVFVYLFKCLLMHLWPFLKVEVFMDRRNENWTRP